MANVLVKPVSDSNGNLVILADNARGISLVDLTTGEIIETGRNTGASNGRDSTVRFSKPGGAYRNVGVMDDRGNILATLASAGQRVQFNYSDYNALIASPPSTIQGYQWDNSQNIQAQQNGQISNADIATMSSEDYINYVGSQQGGSAQSSAKGNPVGALAGAGLAGLGAYVALDKQAAEEAIATGTTIARPVPAAEGFAGIEAAAAPIAPIAGAVLGTALGAKGAYDTVTGKKDNSPVGLASRAQIGITTMGLSELARASGLFGNKSTKDYQRERLSRLESNGAPGAAAFLAQQRQIADNNNDTWQDGPYKGQKWSFDKARELAKQDPTGFIGTLGNFEAFGDGWLGTPLDKQKQVVSKLISEDLYTSDKGDILIKDRDRAREIYDQVMTSSTPSPAPIQANSQPAQSSGIVLKNALTGASQPVLEAPPDAAYEFVTTGPADPAAEQKKMMALSLLGNSPYSQMSSQLLAEAFKGDEEQRKANTGFAQLGAALGVGG